MLIKDHVCIIRIIIFQIHCDKTYEFPRESLNAMADIGLLGLIIPKKLGGLGENHVCASMVVETVARYGCPSTAMVYSELLIGISNFKIYCYDCINTIILNEIRIHHSYCSY